MLQKSRTLTYRWIYSNIHSSFIFHMLLILLLPVQTQEDWMYYELWLMTTADFQFSFPDRLVVKLNFGLALRKDWAGD